MMSFYKKLTLISIVLALIAVCAQPLQVSAQAVSVYKTAQVLTGECRGFLTIARNGMRGTDEQIQNAVACRNYVVGVHDAMVFEVPENNRLGVKKACIPQAITSDDLAEIVANYLDKHPEVRSKAGYLVVRYALTDTFPCP